MWGGGDMGCGVGEGVNMRLLCVKRMRQAWGGQDGMSRARWGVNVCSEWVSFIGREVDVCVFEEGERLECVCGQWGMGVKGEIR